MAVIGVDLYVQSKRFDFQWSGGWCMSRGIGANCRILIEDEKTVIYEYACYNVNQDNWREAMEVWDGLISIEKDAFVEPDIHTKLKRMPSGRKKLIAKSIKKDVDSATLFAKEKVEIKNSSMTWSRIGDYDIMALKLLWKIFDIYQEEGIIPKNCSWFS